jgi:nanoRNase/pAp phosphatase (c-di-AMP/oligoRNAs hydrolase)
LGMMTDTTGRKAATLKRLLKGKRSLLVVVQDYPDPDALASAAALREFAHRAEGLQCTIESCGVVGRSENRALLKYLELPYHSVDEISVDNYDVVALVDTQPGTGNNGFPTDHRADIVIDHHPIQPATRRARFHDIRSRYGATSTIMFQYLQQAKGRLDIRLATGLLYGIRSDTQDLKRDSSRADIDAVLALYPIANKHMLAEIGQSKAPAQYFTSLLNALADARIHGRAVLSRIGRTDIPDAISEAADLLLRSDDVSWSLCSAAYQQNLLFSLRTHESGANAGLVAQRICDGIGSGGGHHSMAGGRLRPEERSPRSFELMVDELELRFLKILQLPLQGKRLCSPYDRISEPETA